MKMRKALLFWLPALTGLLASMFLGQELFAQTNTGRSVLSTSVRTLDFGTLELGSNATRTLSFDIINNSRNTNTGTNQVNLSNTFVSAQIKSSCSNLQFNPTQVDIPTGSRTTIQITFRLPSDPGPFACTVVIVSDETLTGTTTGGTGTNNVHSISSPFIAIEVLANITAPRLALSDFKITRTQRFGTRTQNQTGATITQTGNRGNTELRVDFGSFNVFEEGTFTFKIGNNGNANLQVNVQSTNTRDVTFTGAIGNNITLAPGQTRDLTATIRPVDGGTINASLTINSTGRNLGNLSQRVTMRIVGVGNTINIVPSQSFLNFEARIQVNAAGTATQQDSAGKTEAAPGNNDNNDKDSASEVSAQQQNTGQDSETLTLRNDGKGDGSAAAQVDLEIIRSTSRTSAQANTDPFKFEGGSKKITLSIDQGRSEQVKIIYKPTRPGTDEGTIKATVRVVNTGNVRSTSIVQEFYINLRGTAFAANQSASSASGPVPFAVRSWGLQKVSSAEWVFQTYGQAIASVQAEVYSLAGRRIFDSGAVSGQSLRWRPMNQEGAPLSNGVYLYRLTILGRDGSVQRTYIRKFILLR